MDNVSERRVQMKRSAFPTKIRSCFGVYGSVIVFVLSLTAMAGSVPRANAAAITVSNLNDSGAGSLREAITDAASGDTIGFTVSGTIVLTSGELEINKDLNIAGPGRTSIAVSGSGSSRVFRIDSGAVTISGITISDGSADTRGGGLWNSGTAELDDVTVSNNRATGGGGIFNDGSLTLNNVLLMDNKVFCDCHALGGGLYSVGPAVLHNVTATGNTVGTTGNFGYGSWGGGAAFSGNYAFTIDDSTFDHNSTDSRGNGGGIYVDWEGPPNVTATNVTISSNTASNEASHFGGGVYNMGFVTLINATINGNSPDGLWSDTSEVPSGNARVMNTIMANNSSSNCAGTIQAITSLGHNLDSGDTCDFGATGDIVDADPRLGLLADNGGPTQTIVLLQGSPAIDAADPSNFPPTDQRGISRPQGAGPDIGAYEYGPAGQTLPLSLALNQSAYKTGDPLNVDVTLANPGSKLLADVYFAVLLPASSGPPFGCPLGDALLFFANGMTSASVVCASDPIQSFPRTFEGVAIPSGFPTTTVKDFLSLIWPQGAPAGEYQIFTVVTLANALLDGTVDPGDVVGQATAKISFSP